MNVKITELIKSIFDVHYDKQKFENTAKEIADYLTNPQQLVEVFAFKDNFTLKVKLRLMQRASTEEDVRIYDSYVQSLRSRSGSFMELLLFHIFNPIFQNCIRSPAASGSKKKADLEIDNRIVIDSTTSNRERLKDKVRYLSMYPNRELHLISLDKNPPSLADLATFKSKGVHIAITESAYQKLDQEQKKSPLIHTLKNYINEVRLSSN